MKKLAFPPKIWQIIPVMRESNNGKAICVRAQKKDLQNN